MTDVQGSHAQTERKHKHTNGSEITEVRPQALDWNYRHRIN